MYISNLNLVLQNRTSLEIFLLIKKVGGHGPSSSPVAWALFIARSFLHLLISFYLFSKD